MSRKTIALMPNHHDFDIQPILPIINTPLFQRLNHIRQMGLSYQVFPAATHTRYEHSLHSNAVMRQRTAIWRQDDVITEEKALNMSLYSLLHDIGHSAYSHATEPLCPMDHNRHGLELLSALESEIVACGGDMDLLRSLFKREDPLWIANGHPSLGAEKLAYLKKDDSVTINATGFRMDDMLNHVRYMDEKMAVDIRVLQEAMQLQTDYANMYDRVYCRKACVIAQSFLVKIVHLAIIFDDFSPEKLQKMTDMGLYACLLNTKGSVVKRLAEQLFTRQLPKVAVELRACEHEGLSYASTYDEKGSMSYNLPLLFFSHFLNWENRENHAMHERAIAEICGLSPDKVLFVPNPSPSRFIPADIHVCENDKIIGTLKDLWPAHYQALLERARNRTAVRICVPEEHRWEVSQKSTADKIVEYLTTLAH